MSIRAGSRYRTLEQRRGNSHQVARVAHDAGSAAQIVDIYRRAITPRTKLIVVSHVLFVTGVRMPVEEWPSWRTPTER